MEALLARLCAPAMAGIKPSNLAAVDKRRYPAFAAQLAALNDALNPRGIRFDVLHDCASRATVLVYRPQLLEKALRRSDVAAILSAFGYPAGAPLEEQLVRLKQRLAGDDFPHEIGAFLGYPAEDICGFLNDRREGVLLVGEWKVYANADEAKKRFARFAACRKAVSRRLQNGDTLERIFCAA